MNAETKHSGPVDVLAVLDADVAVTASNRMVEALEKIGWELLSVEIDVTAEKARIELKNGDLRVMFDASHGRSSITSERWERPQCRTGRKSDSTIVSRVAPMFLGRQRCIGFRAGLRVLSHYVADNSAVSIGHTEVRDIFRPLLSGPALANVGSAS
jgi:hypothetical protein